jgi:putative sporulation protein YyaC
MNLKSKFSSKKDKQVFRVLHDEKQASRSFCSQIQKLLPNTDQDIILACIGTDRSTGDSLGPLIGSMLSKKKSIYHIYGTLDTPVHAVNLEDIIKTINETYRNPFIIGIDACLGRHNNVGSITLGYGPVKPGAAVNKQLPEVGDIHITGIVNVSGFMEYFVLQNTRLSLVMNMAEVITEGLYLASLRKTLQNRTLNKKSYKSIN